jgi:hypothetical protein
MNGLKVESSCGGPGSGFIEAFKAERNIPRSLEVVNYRNHTYLTSHVLDCQVQSRDTALVRKKKDLLYFVHLLLSLTLPSAIPVYRP